jgi:hypothetical protein
MGNNEEMVKSLEGSDPEIKEEADSRDWELEKEIETAEPVEAQKESDLEASHQRGKQMREESLRESIPPPEAPTQPIFQENVGNLPRTVSENESEEAVRGELQRQKELREQALREGVTSSESDRPFGGPELGRTEGGTDLSSDFSKLKLAGGKERKEENPRTGPAPPSVAQLKWMARQGDPERKGVQEPEGEHGPDERGEPREPKPTDAEVEARDSVNGVQTVLLPSVDQVEFMLIHSDRGAGSETRS